MRHRLDRYHACRCMEYVTSTPDQIADAMLAELKRPVNYQPVETTGAARAAAFICDLL